ncbi:DUF427 domain-containing protein [Roseibacterium sp. SDUM158017]|uniref:DUF427 domain-containing protein n=1 Tax=Roseicyclus salinarum TaxID=3036773 RepID=UPI0024157867|nr:DUF427 domain-containing protein [Roseibacterium sp. SDUM158017]MDG4647965.1 DUF427 domain-containing protein [Roseibacterium sp. SDUM158017]
MTALPVENVQDYPRPPALERVTERLRVVFGGVTIADTTRAFRVLETHHAPTYYLPPEDVLPVALVPSTRETFCEWKGRAAYFDIVLDTRRSRNAAWCYPAPVAAYAALKDHLSFYAGSVDEAWVGDMKVAPQPGDFYGGWVTPNLTGRIKGAAGTLHW